LKAAKYGFCWVSGICALPPVSLKWPPRLFSFPSMQDTSAQISSLVHRVNLALPGNEKHIVAFISARSGEGTSTVARAFAEGLAAETQRKLLMIDAGPLDAARFVTDGINPGKGIIDAAAAGEDPMKAIFAIEQNVYLGRWLGQDKNRAAAGKLLNDRAFWEKLQAEFDTIVIDAPSPQTSSDGIALTARADATIVVVEAEATRQPVVESLCNTLKAAGAKIIGTVLNKRRMHIPEKIYARL